MDTLCSGDRSNPGTYLFIYFPAVPRPPSRRNDNLSFFFPPLFRFDRSVVRSSRHEHPRGACGPAAVQACMWTTRSTKHAWGVPSMGVWGGKGARISGK